MKKTQGNHCMTTPYQHDAMSSCHRLHRRLPATVLAALLGVASPLLLAATPTPQASTVTIAAGPLNQALNRFAETTGLTLSYTPDLVGGRRSHGVAGAATVDQALAVLLEGTGLMARRTDSGYVIVKAPMTSSTDLDPITVSAAGIVSGVAPVDGYVATASRSATKTDTPLLETPRSVSVVTGDQIEARGARNIEDAVAYTSGVSVGNYGFDPRFDQIQVRGFATTTSGNFLDGLRQPYDSWLASPNTLPYALERIDVIKGPDSVIFGQVSPGGVVNRVSKRPSTDADNEITLTAGNKNTRQAEFDVGGAIDASGDVRYRVVGMARDAESDVEQIPDDASFIAPSVAIRLDDDTTLTLLAQYQDRETGGSPGYYQEGDDLTDFWTGDEDFDKASQHQWQLGWEFEHRFNDALSFSQHTRYQDISAVNQYTDGYDNVGSVVERTASGIYEDTSSVVTDNRLTGEFNTGALEHTLSGGVDYSYLDYDVLYAYGDAPSIDRDDPDYHQHIPAPDNLYADIDGRAERTGVYLIDQIALGRWRFSAGLRHDWAEDVTRDAVSGNDRQKDDAGSGQLGVLYAFDNGVSPYLSYATSFEPQSGTDANGNHHAPSEGRQWEAGVKYQPPGRDLLLTAAVYQIEQTNVLTTDPDNRLYSVATGEQRIRGLELELTTDLTRELSMTAAYTVNDPEITKDNDGNTGNTPVNVSEHLASLWLDYDIDHGPLRGVGLAAGARYIGSSWDDAENTHENDSYTLVDAGAHYDFSGQLEGVRVGVDAHNLADNRYIVCEGGYCYRGSGRSVLGSLSYHW
ncbi:TonB-dependent siderophore receptor [Salinicola acroporae]|uniref:TonB-dependent siderophore receptor n=1 Tax=Salinicola acroporae TaxID=1541440 RepID=A0ABT6I384_9GAMM|nr:TonB-dependent siderophore receptor [Salinicola acroporae]MDH4571874.1 TonB-dependent siderophore receptor [Salinicola acroporae]